jgi:hypothetical protein
MKITPFFTKILPPKFILILGIGDDDKVYYWNAKFGEWKLEKFSEDNPLTDKK